MREVVSTGLYAEKSSKADAPVVMEYPLRLECKLVQMQETSSGYRIVGEIVNTWQTNLFWNHCQNSQDKNKPPGQLCSGGVKVKYRF